ncbi:MAG: hypothetical protein LQ338_007677 [Usnochroma carphineum]|nr:MAG: hypothetical protein LQ338_007677 [Usnochroma carphineum]
MRYLRLPSALLVYLVAAVALALEPSIFGIAPQRLPRSFDDNLRQVLSPNATVSHQLSSAPQWSEYHAPRPGTIVDVATERDVQTVKQVQFCLRNRIPFLAQTGGHGWIDSWHLGQNGVLINLRGLNETTFNTDHTQARVQGGALIEEVIAQAYANDAQILTGNCNCVGNMGAALGGGYGNLMGLYGFSVDNIISMDVVLANGSAVTVTASQNPDLWWALRGAGPNFAIVTGAVMKAYPTPRAQNFAWTGGLYYTEDKIEQVVQAIQDLVLREPMNVFFYYTTTGPPTFNATVLVTPFYFGTEADGRAAFQSLLALQPYKDGTAHIPYTEWNTAANTFCIKGGRKPSYGAGFSQMVPSTWRQIWNAYVDFLKLPGTQYSSILTECYSLTYAQSIAKSTSSFANRDVRFNGAAIANYQDANLDAQAEAFGSKVRALWRSTDGFPRNRTYVNFAFGDETNKVVYDTSTARLRQLKEEYDRYNVFNQWFDIPPL